MGVLRVKHNLFGLLKEKYNKIPIPAKASIWFVVCSILQKGISLITIPIFTRIMTTEQYGQYSTFISWYSIIIIFTSLNLYYGVYNNAMIKYKDHRDEYTSSMQGLTMLLTIIVYIVYLLFHRNINEFIDMTTLLVSLMFLKLLVAPSMEFWLVRNRFEYKYKMVVTITLAQTILGSVVGVIFVIISTDKSLARIASLVLIDSFFCIVIALLQYKRGKILYNKEYWKYAISFNLPLLPHYLSGIILNQGDRVMIGYFENASAVAFYSVAYNIAILINIIIQAINASMTPWMYGKLEERKTKDIRKVTNILCLVMLFVILMLIIFAPELLKIIASKEYGEAVYVIPPVAMSTFFTFMYNIFANVEFFYEEKKFVSIGSILAAISNVILNAIFIPIYGYYAAAYTTLICYIIYSLSHLFFSRITIKKNIGNTDIFDVKGILIFSVVGICMTICSSLLYKYNILRLICVFIIFIIIFIFRNNILSYINKIKKIKRS